MVKIAILLTTYNKGFSNSNEKRSYIYDDVIKWWIYNTPYTIFVTESSNTKFDKIIESNAFVYHFDQKQDATLQKCKNLDEFKSTSESISVHNCFNEFKHKLLNFDFIFKVTGKYKFVNLPDIIENIGPSILSYDFIRQNGESRAKEHNQPGWGTNFWVSTEIIGFKPKYLLQDFYKFTNYNIEHSTYDYIYKSDKKYSVYTMPTVFNIAKWYKQKREIWKEFFTYNKLDTTYVTKRKFTL
jgi:hypothetical protein